VFFSTINIILGNLFQIQKNASKAPNIKNGLDTLILISKKKAFDTIFNDINSCDMKDKISNYTTILSLNLVNNKWKLLINS